MHLNVAAHERRAENAADEGTVGALDDDGVILGEPELGHIVAADEHVIACSAGEWIAVSLNHAVELFTAAGRQPVFARADRALGRCARKKPGFAAGEGKLTPFTQARSTPLKTVSPLFELFDSSISRNDVGNFL